MKHPRTTIGGIFLLVGSLASFVGQWVASKTVPPAESWTVLFAGLNAGVVAVLAADGHQVANVQKQVSAVKDQVEATE